ncbi:hydrolase [Endozoicomonas sp. OPT23]|uniref:hydrolase n=1 Tax=Endozoicomonas sp. OPT23 TaxID=2072845 RepID=UPI00129BC32E|nr:hydrolase [Endozoicomonas sp. OPT23]MRI34400.1 hydrolase [Endozoicomonas sp. OPT23]
MLEVNNTVLTVVDVQGKLATLMAEREALYKNLVAMTAGAKTLGVPVIWVEQIPEKLGATIPEIAELLMEQQPVAKSSFSCCGSSDFNKALADTGRKQVLVVGIEAHICVYQTAMELAENGYDVQVVADAVASRLTANRDLALNKMTRNNIELTCTEMALFELMKTAEVDEFRTVSKLIR